MTKFRISNEFATVDVSYRKLPWGNALELIDARTGLGVHLDALEIEALTSLDITDREALVDWSAGNLRRMRSYPPPKGSYNDDT